MNAREARDAIGNLYRNVNISTAKLTQAGADFLCDEDGYTVQRISDMRDGDYFSITW